jgi:hypothetical protein
MRFPFTFMGLMSVGLAVWATAYLVLRRPTDPVEVGVAATTIVLALGFGAYVLLRRFRRQA